MVKVDDGGMGEMECFLEVEYDGSESYFITEDIVDERRVVGV